MSAAASTRGIRRARAGAGERQAAHLVEVEHKIELAHVAKELVEQLDKEMDRLEVEQLVVAHIDAQGEEEAGVPAVDELVLGVLRGGRAGGGGGWEGPRVFAFRPVPAKRVRAPRQSL